MITLAQFRTDYPEFADVTAYPDSRVQYWLTFANTLISDDRMGDMADYARAFSTAHNLAVWKVTSSGSTNGAPGIAKGVLSAASVADVSKSYDTSIGAYANQGYFNLTVYGQRYLELVLMFGAGGVQF